MNSAGFFFPALMLVVGIVHAEPVAIAAAMFFYLSSRIFGSR